MEEIRNHQHSLSLWQELPSLLVELSPPERSPPPPSFWRIGNKSIFETSRRVKKRANKRLRKQISYSDIDDKIDHLFQGIIEAFEREDNEVEVDINNEDEGDVSLLFIGSDDGSSEVDEDEDDDDDSLPDLIPAEDDSDWEDEGIADCDWFIDMNSLVVLLHRFGLGENLH